MTIIIIATDICNISPDKPFQIKRAENRDKYVKHIKKKSEYDEDDARMRVNFVWVRSIR